MLDTYNQVIQLLSDLEKIDFKKFIHRDKKLMHLDINKLNLQNLKLEDLNLKKVNLEELDPSEFDINTLNLKSLNLKGLDPNDVNLKTLILKHLTFQSLNKKIKLRGNHLKKHITSYTKIFKNDAETPIIIQSFKNILENPEPYNTIEELLLFQHEAYDILKAVSIFMKSMNNYPNDGCREIERKLFQISFIPSDDYKTRILPVYLAHDIFLTTESSCSNFKSSTGSGKTRVSPFIFSIKALMENLERPFFMMTQPSNTIIRDKMIDFQEILGDSVIFVTNKKDLEAMYKKFPKKPVVALFTPRTLVRVISDAHSIGFNLIKYSRIALDEVHERPVDTDVLIAILSKRINKNPFPLHLLLMSATPDQRLHSSFDEFESIQLPNSQLFPVREDQREVDGYQSLDANVRDSTIEIVNEMVNDTFKPGHILIFTSGNRRITNLIRLISESIEKIAEGNSKVRLLKKCENFMKTKQLLYDHLDEVLLDDEDADESLYFLVIKYAGFLSNDEKEIGRDPIPNHPNVIKIIVSTNSIESSITIDGLAAVVDSGIRNTAIFDKEKGVKIIEEGPISIQSQTQRRGRVGRVREGICVQFTIKNHPPIEFTSPAIETDDISSNILDFKKININLEKIDNLPEPGISKENMNGYLKELVKLKALDRDYNLTELGSRLASFPSLSPFVSSSILRVADKFRDNSTIASIVGALAFLVLSSNNLCTDTMADLFRKNFCEDSDIITYMSSLFELMKGKGSTKKRLEKSGFHIGNAIKLIGAVEQIASIIYEDEDKQSLWTDLNAFYSSNDMMKFIQQIIDSIKKVRPDWVNCRRGWYLSVVNILNDYTFVYNGDKSLTEKETVPQIKIRARPGGKGFAAPGSCFIMQVECGNDKSYRGSIIHRDLSRPEIPHPQIIETANYMNNVYTVPLIEGYIGKQREKYNQFQRGFNYMKNVNNGFICYPEQCGDKTIISYVSNNVEDDDAKRLMKEAIEKAKIIIPYTPRTILARNDVLKAIVAVTSVGANNFITKVILYTDTDPIPYQIDKTTINYLIDHLNELNSVDDHLVIAVTGEKFSYLLEDDDFTGLPTTSSIKPCVFSQNSNFYSNLVVLSNKKIPKAHNLNWVDSKVSVTYSDVDALVHVSNMVFRGIVEVSHDHDLIYGMKKDVKVNIIQNNQKINTFNLDFEDMTQRSDVFRPIGCMFDRYAMFCINGQNLVKDVDLSNFNLSIPNKCTELGKQMSSISAFKRENQGIDPIKLIKEIPPKFFNVDFGAMKKERYEKFQRINAIKEEMDKLSKEFNKPGANKKAIMQRQAVLKNEKNNLFNQVNPLTEQIKPYEEFQKQFMEKHKLEQKSFYSLMNYGSSSTNNNQTEVQGLGNNYYLEINSYVDDRETNINAIQNIRNDIGIEVLPLCNIIVNHDKGSNLKPEEFNQKIDEICSHFGGVIKEKSDYQKIENGRVHKGFKRIVIYTGEFAIPFAGEVRKAIGKIDKVVLKIPPRIIPTCLINRPSVVDSMNEWIEQNGLDLQRSGFRYTGNTEEVTKAMNLLASKETQPKIPYRAHTIPGGIEIAKIGAAINRKNYKLSSNIRWGISRTSRLIYAPDDIEDDTIQRFIHDTLLRSKKNVKGADAHEETADDDDENKIIYDYLSFCEDTAVLSGSQIPLYRRSGEVDMKNFCITCAYDLFKNEVDRLFDQEEDRPKMSLLCENVEQVKFVPILTEETQDLWPEVPLGQLLWCLISEPVMNAVTKTWFSAIIYQSLHCSQYFDYCPNHPSILMRILPNRPMKCTHQGCKMFLCNHCHKWHKPGQCSERIMLPPGFRICPNCKRPVEKTEACNRLTCKCGKSFCYYCGWGPSDTAQGVYDHLSKEHNGYFNNPPDYRKFYLHEDVPDKELRDFYKKYPQLKP